MESLALANLTIVRRRVHLHSEGTAQVVTFDSLDLDPREVAGSIFSIHHVEGNTYDVVVVVSTIPASLVEAAAQAHAERRASVFESVETPDLDNSED